ncbi:MAG: DUF4838 domain-containing protein [Ruminococcaceae bacterium]|nr:DUF4838 domain-containing protein [Oscillospiraceae bacterium]
MIIYKEKHMFTINKITSNNVVDFAAEELKKYLRMMMPRCGEIEINYAPDAKDGFRLGVMSDFGLDTSESDDITLDDILHIDTDECGGIIAGSNLRSVLLAVYRYLTINGCRWLFPGIDGEYIPIKDVEPTKYHKMADCRYRGQCNEGAEAQHLMMEEIDFTPKIGMNIFMIEFDNPKAYYDRYYNHQFNQENREPEPVNADTVLQWKRQCEAEIAKRGLQFHDMGHGWTAESFGIDTTDGWVRVDESKVPEESREFIAMLDGKRALFDGRPLNTNFCMSNPRAREKVVKKIADYAEASSNVDYLHVWLADAHNNHCECGECRKRIPTDWYVMTMNELDDELTRRQLDTRIVFICYVDTTWAPKTVFIKNPKRFSLLIAAITRDYSVAVTPNLDTEKIVIPEFELNNITLPQSVDEYLAHGKMWQDSCKVQSFVYEYHFWWPEYRDLGLFNFTKLVHDDIVGYKSNGCNGIVEDGSQRSFFPNGFAFNVYASTLYDISSDHEALKEDYFKHAYGEDYKEVIKFFDALGEAVPYRYFIQKQAQTGAYYNPEIISKLEKVYEIIDGFAPFVNAHKNMPYRAQTVSYRILAKYLEYCKSLTKALIMKADGNEYAARDAYNEFRVEFGKYELEMERCYDQQMCFASLSRIFNAISNKTKDKEEPVIFQQ